MKKMRIIALLLLLTLLLSLIAACGTPGGTAETGDTAETTVPAETRPENELWIVADGSYFEVLKRPIEEFRSEHPDITVTLETIPDGIDIEMQEPFLQRLRAQIMAGRGPDVYLMGDHSPLFQDVMQSMHNGFFADISEFYDADTGLEKEGFVPAVMEAGVLDGARYILPLRYDIPLLYFSKERMDAGGLKPDSLRNGLSGLEEVMQALGNDSVTSAYHFGSLLLYLFPETFDYGTDNVTLTEEEMVEFLRSCKNLLTTLESPGGKFASYSIYIEFNTYWAGAPGSYIMAGNNGLETATTENNAAIDLNGLNGLGPNLRIAELIDTEIGVLPFRNTDGSLVADVTAYGAVGASCDDPGLAYEFLRKLLLKDSQWTKSSSSTSGELDLGGWPILSKGSGVTVEKGVWDEIARRHFHPEYCYEGWEERQKDLGEVTLTEEDFYILDEKIDKAVFIPSSVWDMSRKINDRLRPSRNPDAADVDVNELAAELLYDLRMRLAEG